MTYYAISNERPGATILTKYRLSVWLEMAPFTGEAFHAVKVESADAFRNMRGGYDLAEKRYYYDGEEHIHGCENGLEAAAYVASKMGLTLL